MTTPETTAVARRLDRDRALQTRDGLLALLATLGATGVPVAVGMIVDGRIIRGAFSAPSVLAAATDRAVGRALEVFGSSWDEETRALVVGAFAREADRYAQERDEALDMVERYNAEAGKHGSVHIDDLALEDVPTYYFALAPSPAVEVAQAEILMHGEWVRVGVMRVAMAHIAAWWPLDEEDGPTVTYGATPEAS